MVYVNIIRMRWKNFLYFSPAEKIAVLLLMVIIVLFFGLNVVLSKRSTSPISIPQNDSLIAAFERLQESLEDKRTVSINNEYKTDKKTEKKSLHENDSKREENRKPKQYTENPQYTKQKKFTEANSIALNETDTAQWKMVPGIGSAYSARIVKYQKMLGGYISINQLKEVYGITDEVFDAIVPFINMDNIGLGHCVKLNINQLEFKEILAHPYINYEQTKAIVNLRRRTGDITSASQLAMLDEFSPEDIERISPYLDF